MSSQRIRPSPADLAELDIDLDAPAFTEWELNNSSEVPAVTVSRVKPPKITTSTTLPPPVPEIAPRPSPVGSKPKSRFALQREKEQQSSERFELNFEQEEENEERGGGGGALPKSSSVVGFSSLVKNVSEKKPTMKVKPPTTSKGRPSGFPPIGKGVFPRKTTTTTTTNPPSTSYEADEYRHDDDGGSVQGLLNLVSKENEQVLQGMSRDQILEQQRQIREEMGLSQGLINMLQQRGAARKNKPTPTPTPTRRTRSPLPSPTATVTVTVTEDEEEGTPEYIRKHFFPNEPVNRSLDWMKPPPPPPPSSSASPSSLTCYSSLVFDLSGQLVSNETAAITSQGGGGEEHHVSSSTRFTIPSLLQLTQSSVPSQRSTAFTTLLKILRSNPPSFKKKLSSEDNVNDDDDDDRDWKKLLNKLVEKAGWALRDPNKGVVMVSIDLLHYIFELQVVVSTAAAVREAEDYQDYQEEEEEEEVKKKKNNTLLDSFDSVEPFSIITKQFSSSSRNLLPQSSNLQLLKIVVHYVELSLLRRRGGEGERHLDLILYSRNLLESIVKKFISIPSWPPTTTSTQDDDDSTTALPSPIALKLLTYLASSSRVRAKEIYSNNRKSLLIEPSLKFLAILPWELTTATETESKLLGYEMLTSVFKLWETLARFGLGCQLRTLSKGILDQGIFDRIFEITSSSSEEVEDELSFKWFESFLKLLSIWTTAAIDPHVTSPSHDIVWSQVETWNEVGLKLFQFSILDSSSSSSKGKLKFGLMGNSLELLVNWLRGSKLNKSWSGEKEREWIKSNLDVQQLEELLVKSLNHDEIEEEEVNFVIQAIKLSLIHEEKSNPPSDKLFKLDQSLIESTLYKLLSRHSHSHSHSRESIELMILLVSLIQPEDRMSRLKFTIQILPLLDHSQAVSARDLISHLISSSSSFSFSFLDRSLEVPSLIDLHLLKPFYTHLIVTNSRGRVIGPLFPSSRDLKLTHSLLAPQATRSKSLLLSKDWPLTVLDELLKSQTSPIFNNPLPKDWDASELQLVKSCLVLMRIVDNVYRDGGRGRGGGVEGSELVYDLIKVYMLEKDTVTSSEERDLFLNPSIQFSICELLKPFRLSSSSSPQRRRRRTPAQDRLDSLGGPLEQTSQKYSTLPFYQLYTNFLGLYDSNSYSIDKNFKSLLLVPLSQNYSYDYRRLIWSDQYGHLLKSFNLNFTDLLIIQSESTRSSSDDDGLSEWLYPVETNETILIGYLKSLNQGLVDEKVSPLMTFLAVHHLSEYIFNFNDDDSLRKTLIKGLIEREKEQVIKMVFKYQQTRTVGERLTTCFKECFETIQKDELETRLKLVKDSTGKDLSSYFFF